uniref:Uncharacterized protein n=1 Tax=Physcomitrium patens TaxID=3218 RepID=A0A2K1IDP7_PHYPA|nr:hypothetical protein PHYPA_029548 [Physcomitrium patens]
MTRIVCRCLASFNSVTSELVYRAFSILVEPDSEGESFCRGLSAM